MKKKVGLWIDHRKTVIVMLSGETEEIVQIASNVDKHARYSGEAEDVSPEDQRDRRFSDHLSKYYDEVISRVRDAESILVLGPGEAKGEFVKRLQHEGLSGLIVGVETDDKMTDRQIASRVRQHFLALS
jgi:stalled ribosome rescue protein Dom34